MEYKAKKKSGVTYFKEISVDWSIATQKDLKRVFDLGYTKFVTKEDAKPKKTKSEAKEESSKDNSDKE
jgi:uncharacterized Ntn-hydrolase superfamily protein